MTQDLPYLPWDERDMYKAWYTNHPKTPGTVCLICQESAPCPRYLTAKERLRAAGYLDRTGAIRATPQRDPGQ